MNYKIIACDLDGTLFDSSGRLSDENIMAISDVSSLGVQFVPTSGRTLSDIPDPVRNHPSVRYIIHSSGAVVYDKLSGEKISFCMPKSLSEPLLDLLLSTECHLSVRRGGVTYVDALQMSEDKSDYYNVWDVHWQLLVNYAEPIQNFKETILAFDEIEMISVFFKDDSELCRVRDILQRDDRLNVVSVCPYNLEIIFKDAEKGRALAALADKLSVPIEQTIAVGDSQNDISMIKAAGLGLAMENAKSEVKSEADEVICHCDEHAVKFIKEKYIQI